MGRGRGTGQRHRIRFMGRRDAMRSAGVQALECTSENSCDDRDDRDVVVDATLDLDDTILVSNCLVGFMLFCSLID